MEQHELLQGSDEWHAHRASHFNASDAPAMMGASQYKTRSQLLHEMATGIMPEIDASTQRLFDAGHRFEALARPLAEKIVGKKLYPVVGSEGKLSASFDGLTMDESICFEHKTLNDALRVVDCAADLPEHYRIQMMQQMMVSGARECLFMASKWDADDVLIAECHHFYHYSDDGDELRQRIIDGWNQFAKDLDAYVPTETTPAAVAAPIMDLPAIVITATGSLAVETNFARWGMELQDFIARIPAKPSTDQEFADCKAAVAALKKAEVQLDAEESRVLSMVPSIDDMKREKKLLRDLSSVTRLALEKLVVQRETAVKVEIMQAGKDALAEHVDALNKRLATVQMPPIVADFAATIKSKRNLENMRGAVSDLVAAKKIESNALADKIQINLKTIDHVDVAYKALFADFAALVMKAPDDLDLVIKSRLDAEDKRRIAERDRILEAEREKMQADEERKAREKVAAEQAAERAKVEAEAKAQKALDDLEEETLRQQEAAEAKKAPEPAVVGVDLAKPSADQTVRNMSSGKRAQPAPIIIDRPTDAEIIGALAVRFAVSEQTVTNWLADMVLEKAA